MDFAILQSGLHLSDVLVALHRFPSSHARPLFCLRWHLNGVGLLPPPAATNLAVGRQAPTLVAAHVAHGRQPCTWCTRRLTSKRRSSRLRTAERVRPRQEARLVCPAFCQLSRNSAEEPTQTSTARLVRSALHQLAANLPASRSAFTSITPRAASASLGTATAPCISGLAKSSA